MVGEDRAGPGVCMTKSVAVRRSGEPPGHPAAAPADATQPGATRKLAGFARAIVEARRQAPAGSPMPDAARAGVRGPVVPMVPPRGTAPWARQALAALPGTVADPRPRMEPPTKPPTFLERAERATQHGENFGFGAVASFPKGAVATGAELLKGGNALRTLVEANAASAPGGGLAGSIAVSVAADMLRGASALPLPGGVTSGLSAAADRVHRAGRVDQVQRVFDQGNRRRAGIEAWRDATNAAIDGHVQGQGAEIGASYHLGTTAIGLYETAIGLRGNTAPARAKVPHDRTPAGTDAGAPALRPAAPAALPPGEPRQRAMPDALEAMPSPTHAMAPGVPPGIPGVLAKRGAGSPPGPPAPTPAVKPIHLEPQTDPADLLRDMGHALLPGQAQQLRFLATAEGRSRMSELLRMASTDGSEAGGERFFAEVALKVRELALLGQGTEQAEIAFQTVRHGGKAGTWRVHPLLELGGPQSVSGWKGLKGALAQADVDFVFDGHTHPLMGVEIGGDFLSGSASTGFSQGDLAAAEDGALFARMTSVRRLGARGHVQYRLGNVSVGGGAVMLVDPNVAAGARVLAAAGDVISDHVIGVGTGWFHTADVLAPSRAKALKLNSMYQLKSLPRDARAPGRRIRQVLPPLPDTGIRTVRPGTSNLAHQAVVEAQLGGMAEARDARWQQDRAFAQALFADVPGLWRVGRDGSRRLDADLAEHFLTRGAVPARDPARAAAVMQDTPWLRTWMEPAPPSAMPPAP